MICRGRGGVGQGPVRGQERQMAGVDEHNEGGAEGRAGVQISEVNVAHFVGWAKAHFAPYPPSFFERSVGTLRFAHPTVLSVVIARSEATKQSTLPFRVEMDCFASLAMTLMGPNYAAFLLSARLASWRKISVVPSSRSSGVFHSWKNTTFMSGRTFAAWPCWRMKNTRRSGCANLLSRKVTTAPFGPASTFSTLALRQ